MVLITAWTTALAFPGDAQGPEQGQSANHPAASVGQAPSVTILEHDEARGILGREVLSATNEDMGRIVDVIIDRSGVVLLG